MTSEFNLCEVAFAVCRDYPEQAEQILSRVRSMILFRKTTDKDYCCGAALKKKASGAGKKLSIIDCVGYSVASRLGIPFLTGDHEFADIPHVEYVR